MQQSQLLTFDVFRGISQYLSIKDLLNLQSVSMQMKDNVQLALKALLASIGFNNPNTTTPYNIIFRTIFGRETYFWSFDESVKPFKRRHILGMPVKSIQIGLTYTGILTIQNRMYICLSQEYQEVINQKPKFIIKQDIQMHIFKRFQVKQYSAASKGKFIYLKENGDLIVMFDNQEEYLISKNVEHFETSYYQLVAIFTNPQKIPQLPSEQTRAILYQLQDLTPHNCDQAQKYKQIILPDNEIITQVAIGSSAIYYLTKTQKVYSSDTKNEQVIDPIIKTVHQNYFDKRSIISIYSGLNYFLALSRESIKSIKEWTNEELQVWLAKIGFSDYVNIVKYNEFTGLEFSKQAVLQDFQINTLGLTNAELQIKLSTEITRSMELQYKDYQLFGWGKNDYGQLAAPLSNNVQFTKVALPNLDEDDEIIQIECGWKNVAILTHSGKLYLTENQQKQIKREKDIQQQQQQQQQQDEGGKKRKKSRQEPKDIKDQKEQKEPEQQLQQQQQSKYWSDISKIFIKSNDKREYRHYYVNLSKDYLVVVCSIFDKKTMLNYFPEMLEQKEMQKKFKPTLQVIDRILWDTKFNKEDFIVGYEDRFLGIMEVPFTDFIISQVKSHRVQYFKQKGKIVWDRPRRLDLL
ncbi:unnamed protein product (macronuclear) [Paramecium tetraurelia]|uniref:SAM domain-containing protein n=1 Tax=Paramecium tetraurelia TaxID=5888 RepID=A0DND8_PARTE|nr:uncharacterized protein GSPATT00018751001 [Paramecium tetraurelia]CAK84555.1 unnamed protein product [Paramecium tetraurelia]|eukprot:XP_001451952.1 hypothetical protein (macronuclear) [Paramecium tetraurelia strain d4-2]